MELAVLGGTQGCILAMKKDGKTLENGEFEPGRDCLLEREKDYMEKIAAIMDDHIIKKATNLECLWKEIQAVLTHQQNYRVYGPPGFS